MKVFHDVDPLGWRFFIGAGGELVSVVRSARGRMRVSQEIEGESRTVDSVGYESDINTIVKRFKRDGFLPPNLSEPVFADVSGLNEDLTVLINRSSEALKGAVSNDLALAKQRELAKAAESKSNVTEVPPPEPSA